MATLRASLNISSPDVVSSEINLNISMSDTIDSGYLMKVKVGNTDANLASTPAPLKLYKANDKSESAYLFVRNMADQKEKYLFLMETQEEVFAKIPGGTFAIIPIQVSKNIYVYATETDQLVEYALFGNDSSTVNFS
jgi:hypothetical protein